jgi:tetratricopeptide (TPR) repeat protein
VVDFASRLLPAAFGARIRLRLEVEMPFSPRAEVPMKRYAGVLVAVSFCFLFLAVQAGAQGNKIEIAAGTPEDHDLQLITNEQDAGKRLAMYQDFVQKYSANPAAVAYGNWQISQAYQAAGDLNKALDYGDKALGGSPRNLDILVSQASIAQQAKDNAKLMDYSAKGGEVCNSIGKHPKPDGVTDNDFKHQVEEEKAAVKSSCDFLESVGFSVIANENDAKLRMADIDRFSAVFPDSKYQDQISSYALYALGQLNDQTRLLAYAQKALAANPNSLPALLLLANFYGDDKQPGSAAKAVTYAQKAIEVAKPDAPDADKSRKLSAGVAHNIVGYTYAFKQDKTVAAIPELRAAAALLKGQDDQQYARALYGLGYAYGKLNKLTEARDVLTEAVKIPSPWQKIAEDLLEKVNAARAKGK